MDTKYGSQTENELMLKKNPLSEKSAVLYTAIQLNQLTALYTQHI